MAKPIYTIYVWYDDNSLFICFAKSVEEAARRFQEGLIGKPPFRLVAYDGRFLNEEEKQDFKELTGVNLQPLSFTLRRIYAST